jgi:predicted metal-binding membrane protein
MPARPMLVEVLKRDRAIVAFGLAGVVTLSWTYLIYMDWGMRRMDVGMEMVIMPAMQHWTAWDLVLVFLMWAVMMVAMMVPAASPVILLFAEINRRRNEQQDIRSLGQFLLGYLTAWTCAFCHPSAVGPAYGGIGFTDDGEH